MTQMQSQLQTVTHKMLGVRKMEVLNSLPSDWQIPLLTQ